MKSKINIVISPQGEPLRELIEQISSGGIPAEAEEIQRGRNVIAALAIPGKGRINIKAFGKPNIVNRFVYGCLRKSKARRSYENSMRLQKMGFNVPAPLAYIEETGAGGFGRSFFISTHEEGLTEMRHPEQWTFMESLLTALGAELARLHAAGVWMKDFSPGNILFRRDASTGVFSFYYVDLNRLIFTRPGDWRLELMWERLLFSRSQIATMTAAYASARGDNPETILAIAMKRHNHYLRSRGMTDID